MISLEFLGSSLIHIELLEHEFRALLEALRRDYRQQSDYSNSDENSRWHGCNARMDLRLLEILQPKTSRPHMVFQPKAEATNMNSQTETVESVAESAQLIGDSVNINESERVTVK